MKFERAVGKATRSSPECPSRRNAWVCSEHWYCAGKTIHVATHDYFSLAESVIAVWDDEGHIFEWNFPECPVDRAMKAVEEWYPVSKEELADAARSLALALQEIEQL